MPYYLSEYIGAGSRLDPFRPRGSDQKGWSAIDLRPDGGRTVAGGGLNACLLHLPVHDPDPKLEQFGTDRLEILGPASRGNLFRKLGATQEGFDRLDEMIAGLLMRPPANGWKPLRGRRRGSGRIYEIYLGGKLWEAPQLAGASRVDESFTKADEDPINSADHDWTDIEGGEIEILSNECVCRGNTSSERIRCETALATDDMSVSVKITKADGTGGFAIAMPMARLSGGPAAEECYFCGNWFEPAGPTDEHRLRKFKQGSFETDLVAANPQDFVLNERIEVKCDGDSISGLVDSVEILGPATDTAIASSLKHGIFMFCNHTSNDLRVDDYIAVDLRSSLLRRHNPMAHLLVR